MPSQWRKTRLRGCRWYTSSDIATAIGTAKQSTSKGRVIAPQPAATPSGTPTPAADIAAIEARPSTGRAPNSVTLCDMIMTETKCNDGSAIAIVAANTPPTPSKSSVNRR